MTTGVSTVRINKVSPDAPWRWLSGAAKDLTKAPLPCLLYGGAFALMSVAVTYVLIFSGNLTWMFVLTGGFMLLGPMLALGLYQAAKMLENGETPTLTDMFAIRPASGVQLGYLGLALIMLYLFWGGIAKIVYMLSTSRIYNNVEEFLSFLTSTQAGFTMLVVGTLIGAVIALVVYSIAVVTAPLLYDRDTDIITAIVASVKAVKTNPGAMLQWAGLIVVLVGLSIIAGFVGLVFVFPWLGLATWHAYRDLVSQPSEVGSD